MKRVQQGFLAGHSPTLILIAINVLFFGLQVFFPAITELFILRQFSLIQPWRFITAMFLHSGLSHLFINMFVLYMFGGVLEHHIGKKRFLIVYLTAGILANIISHPFYTAALGASGATSGIVGVVMMLMPNLPVLLYFMIPMKLWVAGVLFILLDIVLAVTGATNIGAIAHLAGVAIGILFGLHYKKTVRRVTIRQ